MDYGHDFSRVMWISVKNDTTTSTLLNSEIDKDSLFQSIFLVLIVTAERFFTI